MPGIVNEVSKNIIGEDFHMAMAFKLEKWTCCFCDEWDPVTTCSLYHDIFEWLFVPVHIRSLVSSINFWHVSNKALQKCMLASCVSVCL
jgi:hypothetical protein